MFFSRKRSGSTTWGPTRCQSFR